MKEKGDKQQSDILQDPGFGNVNWSPIFKPQIIK